MATSTRPGDVLAGRYRLVDLLAESGGGRFWRAQDTMLERFVALHVLSEDDPRAEELMAAARASATFHDARVLRVLDAATDGGLCYVVNEWGNGTSLDILLARAEPLGPRRSSWLVAEVAGAVAVAHQHGVTHGRLNPEAVLIDRFGAIRLIGLGVDAALHGIPRGDRAADRADLGGLLYCCLTGTWPGPSSSHVPAAPREHDTLLPPRRVRAGVPRPLDDLWREIAEQPHRGRGFGHSHPDVASAQAIRDRLLEFIGDPTGLPQALASSIPAINELQPVDLPAVPDPRPHPEPESDRPAERSAGGSAIAADDPASGAPDHRDDRGDRGDPDDTAPNTSGEETTTLDASAAGGPETTETTARTDGPDTTPEPNGDEDPPDSDAPSDAPTQVTPLPEPDAQGSASGQEDLPTHVSISDLPTEAGMPVFDDDHDDVDWFRAGRTPPPPPPELKDPEPRPLFAPEPEDGGPVRRPREGVAQPKPARLDPMPSSPPPPPGDLWASDADTAEQPAVPGRNWFRLAVALGSALVLLVAVVVAFNLGRGRTPLGAEREDDPTSASPTVSASPISGVEVTDFDPFGDPPEEHPETASRAADGDESTTWRTSTYLQQFGPGGLKAGVGLLIDLGESHEVTEVDLSFVGSPTTAEIHVYDGAPGGAPTGGPAATGTARNGTATLEPTDVSGQYVLVWLTSIPKVAGGFRGEVAEVVVHGR